MAKVRNLALIVSAGAVAAAVAKELRRPAAERTWHGRLGGVVPYELRPPTAARLRERLWNPEEPRILTYHVFGVGWAVNLGRVAKLVKERRA